MRSIPAEIRPEDLVAAIRADWGLTLDGVDYHSEGGGAYHWVARPTNGPALFVTIDDLDTKPWLGDDRCSALQGLVATYATALELRRSTGLRFVVAPMPTASGAPCVRFGSGYALALFPFAGGVPGHWGEPLTSFDRAELVALLADLHHSAPTTGSVLRHAGGVPGRTQLEDSLNDVDEPWEGGPLSEPARVELASAAPLVIGWLSELDALTARTAGTARQAVVTHGEPHPGNLIRTADGVLLVDWDTVALGPPERDLWMFDDDAWGEYERLTGCPVCFDTIRIYRLVWALADVASFVTRLRAPHDANVDDKRSLAALRRQLALEEPAPYGTPLL